MDGAGNVFIADRRNHRIRRVDGSTGVITTVAGNGVAGFSGDGGPATNASILSPRGVDVDGAGNLFIADQGNHRIRLVDGNTGLITTVAGNGVAGFAGDGGPATSARLNSPRDVAVDGAGNLFIACEDNNRIRRVETAQVPEADLSVVKHDLSDVAAGLGPRQSVAQSRCRSQAPLRSR